MAATHAKHRALAVIRHQGGETSIYEAWLYHRPEIRVSGPGVELTKMLLALAFSDLDDPLPEMISADDVAAALDSEGDDVMIFYAEKPLLRSRHDPIRIRVGPVDLERLVVAAPEPAPIGPTIGPRSRRRPPPQLEPKPLSATELECLATLNAIYHCELASLVVPGARAKIWSLDPEKYQSFPEPRSRAAIYEQFIPRFAAACSDAFGGFPDITKG